MKEWRDIPAVDIDWARNPISLRAGYKVRMLCNPVYRAPGDGACKRYPGSWSDWTLGQIANEGEFFWLRCTNIGPKAVEVIKWVIDRAAEGNCPMRHDTTPYVPQAERKEAEE